MENPLIIPAAAWLERQGINFKLFVHPGSVYTLEQAAHERGQNPEQIIRTLLFRKSQGQFFLALIAGNHQVDWKILRRHLTTSRVTLATGAEVKKITGALPGSVSPFGLSNAINMIADPRIFLPDEVSLGSGISGIAIILTRQNLARALDKVEIINLY